MQVHLGDGFSTDVTIYVWELYVIKMLREVKIPINIQSDWLKQIRSRTLKWLVTRFKGRAAFKSKIHAISCKRLSCDAPCCGNKVKNRQQIESVFSPYSPSTSLSSHAGLLFPTMTCSAIGMIEETGMGKEVKYYRKALTMTVYEWHGCM